jgi:hypothetical protein
LTHFLFLPSSFSIFSAKQAAKAFDVAKTSKRAVPKKTIDLATTVVANVEQALYKEKESNDQKVIKNTQKIALNLVKSADEISNVVAFSLLSSSSGSGGTKDVTFKTKAFDLQVSKKEADSVLGSIVKVGGTDDGSSSSSSVQFQLPSTGLTFDGSRSTEFHSVLWARNPFTYFEPTYNSNVSKWADDSLNFPVASLRLRQYNTSGDANDVRVYNLPEPITITFPFQQSYNNATNNKGIDLVCVWWNDQVNDWSGDGCSKPIISRLKIVQCDCTHLTNFAVRDLLQILSNFLSTIFTRSYQYFSYEFFASFHIPFLFNVFRCVYKKLVIKI